jgi:hypothetical protein
MVGADSDVAPNHGHVGRKYGKWRKFRPLERSRAEVLYRHMLNPEILQPPASAAQILAPIQIGFA